MSGIIAAIYSLGAICSLPFIPIINQRFGRRWSIFGGSCVMVVAAIIQCCSVHVGMYIAARWILGFGIPICKYSFGYNTYPRQLLIIPNNFRHRRCLVATGRTGLPERTTDLDIAFQFELLYWRSSCSRNLLWHPATKPFKLVLAGTITPPSDSVSSSNKLDLVRSHSTGCLHWSD